MSLNQEPSTTTRSPPPRRPSMFLIYAAAALGLVAILFRATESTTTTTSLQSSSSTTSLPRTVPLATLVPGLSGTLHAVEGSGQLDLVSWAADGPLSFDAFLPAGRPDQIAVDAAGRLLGISILGTTAGAGSILVGSSSGLSDLGFAATSFVWDQSEPGSMAAVTAPTGSGGAALVNLKIAAGAAPSAETILPLGPQDVVLASGTWGFLLARRATDVNQVVLVDSTGNQVWSRHAHWAYASPTGDLLLSFNNNEIREFHRLEVDSDPADPGAWFELPSLGVTGVSWSPDSGEIAVVSIAGGVTHSRLEIYDEEGQLLRQIPLEWRVWDVEWSPDGRFLVMPGTQERAHAVLFYDVEHERLTPVMFDRPVQVAVMAS